MAATPKSRPGIHHVTVVPTNYEAVEGDADNEEPETDHADADTLTPASD